MRASAAGGFWELFPILPILFSMPRGSACQPSSIENRKRPRNSQVVGFVTAGFRFSRRLSSYFCSFVSSGLEFVVGSVFFKTRLKQGSTLFKFVPRYLVPIIVVD